MPIVEVIVQNRITGLSCGTITRVNVVNAPAPSIAAASYCSRPTPWSPASRITAL
nr:hypothetical protein [Actinomadura sp. J1-007]